MSRIIKEYSFHSEIGAGTFSTVYRGYDTKIGIEVAIKVCLKSAVTRKSRLEYVYREMAALMACLSEPHPCIPTLFACIQDQQHLFYVLQLAEQQSLADCLAKYSGKVNVCVSSSILAEVVSAIDYLHNNIPERIILHRDIKPDNILFKKNCHVLLCDYGSVKLLDKEFQPVSVLPAPKQPPLTPLKSSFNGTPLFMPPETVNCLPPQFGTDIWAIGVIAYHMDTRKYPFEGNSVIEVVDAIKKGQVSYTDCSPAVSDFVQKILKADPKERLGSPECGGINALKRHEFFSNVQFDAIHEIRPTHASWVEQTARVLPPVEWDSIPPDFNAEALTRMALLNA